MTAALATSARMGGVLLPSLAFGLLLAGHWPLPLPAGLIGAALLVAAALWARRHWTRQQAIGIDPARMERVLWLDLAGTALILGYFGTVLATPGSEVHRHTGDTGGMDTWLMAAGALVAWSIVGAAREPLDERDHLIAAAGQRTLASVLVLSLLVLALYLGFAPPPWRARMTHWWLGNLLIWLVILAMLGRQWRMLGRYLQDRLGPHEQRS